MVIKSECLLSLLEATRHSGKTASKANNVLEVLEALTNYQDFSYNELKFAKEEFKKYLPLEALKGLSALPMRTLGYNKYYFVELAKNKYFDRTGYEIKAENAADAKAQFIFKLLKKHRYIVDQDQED
jgi:hypothetical protein